MLFTVWAPTARSVDLVLGVDGHCVTLEMNAQGQWWQLEVDCAGPGTRYRFSVDACPPVPDPRSASQPDGVHGSSEVVDHKAFLWTDQRWTGMWLPSAVVYELHIGTFTPEGTFESAIERIDHLAALGITAIELLPPVEFPGERGWGYDGVDLFAPHHAYGGATGLKLLVDACHQRGLGVVIDVVYNHLGPDGNYLDTFGPYFTDRYKTPWGRAINFDGEGSEEVRQFVLDNACMWFRDYHADGLRLDAVHEIYDFSATHILEQLRDSVSQLGAHLGRNLVLIAESDLNDSRLVRSTQAGGYGLDAAWSDDFHHALHVAITGEHGGYYSDYDGLADVARALKNHCVYTGQHSNFRGRTHGHPSDADWSWRFLGYLQNHDQIGNRAIGERMSSLVGHERLKVAAALVLLGPFVPMLFQGEEWGASTPFQYFTDHVNEQLGKAVKRGRKRECAAALAWVSGDVPDPQAQSTFLDSKLNWDELTHPAHTDLMSWHRLLIALRKAEPAFTDGGRGISVMHDDGLLTIKRGNTTTVANLRDQAWTADGWEGWSLLLGSSPSVRIDLGTLNLASDSVAVLHFG